MIGRLGITYSGKGPGGEFYSKHVDSLTSVSIWTEGNESWTPEELEAIAQHKRDREMESKTELDKLQDGTYYYLNKADSDLYDRVKSSKDEKDAIIKKLLEDKSAKSRAAHCRCDR